MFSNDYALVFASRFLFGAGVGLFNSLTISLIARFYKGDALSSMMGFQSTAGSLGAASVAFLVSYLVTLGWHQTFLIYAIALPILLLFTLFVPLENDHKGGKAKNIKNKEHLSHQKINFKIIQLALLIFILFAFFLVSQFKLPELVVTKKIATLSQVSLLSGITTLVGIPVGASYGFIKKKLGGLILPLGFLLTSLGFILLSLADSLMIIALGVIILGIGFGFCVPSIYVLMADYAPVGSENLASTVLLVFTNVGVFLSPAILNFIGSFVGGSSAQMSMNISAVIFMIIFVVSISNYLISSKKNNLKLKGAKND